MIVNYMDKWINILHNKIFLFEDGFEHQWYTRVLSKPKLRLYKLIKNTLCIENYICKSDIDNHSNIYANMIRTWLRSGTNSFRIDIGRRDKLEVKDRICEICYD